MRSANVTSSVEKRCRLSRYGGDCYGYALVAMGFVDLVIETDLKRWDIAPLIPIIEGAGGIVTNWEGRAMTDGGNVIAAGDRRVHAEALEDSRRLAPERSAHEARATNASNSDQKRARMRSFSIRISCSASSIST